MARGSASWSYDEVGRAWYVKLDERGEPPYRTQIIVSAILDIDGDGRLACIEILDHKPDGSPIEPPLNAGGVP